MWHSFVLCLLRFSVFVQRNSISDVFSRPLSLIKTILNVVYDRCLYFLVKCSCSTFTSFFAGSDFYLFHLFMVNHQHSCTVPDQKPIGFTYVGEYSCNRLSRKALVIASSYLNVSVRKSVARNIAININQRLFHFKFKMQV